MSFAALMLSTMVRCTDLIVFLPSILDLISVLVVTLPAIINTGSQLDYAHA